MSNALLTAVFEQSHTRNAARLLMLALADRANEQGTCWPSIADLMQRTGLSKAGIFAATRKAVELGELHVEPYRGPNHTHRYTVQIPNGSEYQPFRIKTDTVQNIDINGSESEPKPIGTLINPHSLDRKTEKPGRRKTGKPDDSGFDQFWNAYPRKVSKPEAIRAWRKTAKTRPPLPELLNALAKHKARWNDPKFIPHPATWINGERWNDELADRTPPRREIRVTSDIKEVRL